MQLYTAQNFTVVRQIADHTDATVYYVRAVIRNAYTDEIIETLDLTSKGSQRYKKDWKIPADPSGEGFYVSIVTSVYEDSGHTTKSSLYGDEENTYMVIDKPIQRGGGGSGISARMVREIFTEEFQKIKNELLADDGSEEKMMMDCFEKTITALNSVKNELKDELTPEKPEKVNFKPLLDSISTFKKEITTAVSGIEVPKVDLSPVIDAVIKMNEEGYMSLTQQKVLAMVSRAVGAELSKINFATTFITSAMIGKEKMRDAAGPKVTEKPVVKKVEKTEEKKIEEKQLEDITKLEE